MILIKLITTTSKYLFFNKTGLKKVYEWLRPDDVILYKRDKDYPITLFHSSMKPTDVIQGELGSCWFISALSALTLKPHILNSFITPQAYNPSGYYQGFPL